MNFGYMIEQRRFHLVLGKSLCQEKTIKIYTRTGDFGKTSLFSGERVHKSHDRVEACGEVDELNAFLGVVSANLPEGHEEILGEIHTIQSALFHIGARLSTTPGSPLLSTLKEIGEEEVHALEQAIDRMEEALSPVRGFILPGGHPTAAVIHAARTVCRRSERRVVRLYTAGKEEGRARNILAYLNRLSDYLFVLARYCNYVMGVADIPWKK
jgi:cob(I)alamin adenosyltransferase